MSRDFLANFCEKQLQTRLEGFVNAEVVAFTPSISNGKRYIGFRMDDGKDYLIEINVTEVEE